MYVLEYKSNVSKLNCQYTNGPLNAEFKFTFKNDDNFKQKFSRFVDGEEFEQIEMDKSVLEDFKFSASSINLLDDDIEKYKLILMRAPIKEGFTDIIFEDGFELPNIKYKIFSSKKKVQVSSTYKGLTVQITFGGTGLITSRDNVHFKFMPSKVYENTTDALNTCILIERFTLGLKFSLYPHGTTKTYEFAAPANPDYNAIIKEHLEFYEQLKKIEIGYKIKFRDIPYPTNELFNLGTLALDALNNKEIIVTWNGELEFDLDEEGTPLELLLKLNEKGTMFRAESTEPEIIELLGHKIQIGYKSIIYTDLCIINLDKLIKKEESMAKVISKTKTAKIIYEKTRLQEKYA